MKMNIEITKLGTKFLDTDEKIVEICICNGNWKYWDYHMECEENEKTSLTINTINQAHFLHYPIKDAYPIHNKEEAIENNNLIVEDAIVRTYESLLTYLNCRINNMKEDYKKYGWTDQTTECTLFEMKTRHSRNGDVVGDIVYRQKELLQVRIEVIE